MAYGINLGGQTRNLELAENTQRYALSAAEQAERRRMQYEQQTNQNIQNIGNTIAGMLNRVTEEKMRKNEIAQKILGPGATYEDLANDYAKWQKENPDGGDFQGYVGSKQAAAKLADMEAYKKAGVMPYGMKPYQTPQEQAEAEYYGKVGMTKQQAELVGKEYGIPTNEVPALLTNKHPIFERKWTEEDKAKYMIASDKYRQAISNPADFNPGDSQMYAQEMMQYRKMKAVPRDTPDFNINEYMKTYSRVNADGSTDVAEVGKDGSVNIKRLMPPKEAPAGSAPPALSEIPFDDVLSMKDKWRKTYNEPDRDDGRVKYEYGSQSENEQFSAWYNRERGNYMAGKAQQPQQAQPQTAPPQPGQPQQQPQAAAPINTLADAKANKMKLPVWDGRGSKERGFYLALERGKAIIVESLGDGTFFIHREE